MTQLLTSNLWKDAAKLAGKAKRREAAIAYVTTSLVKFGKGDVLITDASPRAIQCGETSATVLQDIFRRGTKVFSCPNLHAKVLILDDTAIIGSANLSRSSAELLEECAVLTQERKLVGQARAFLQQLRERSQALSAEDLERLAALPVTRRASRRLPKKRTAVLGKRCWIIGITPLDEEDLNESDHATRRKAERKAVAKQGGNTGHLYWVRMKGSSKMRKEAIAGDRVILVSGNSRTTNHLTTDAAVTILSHEDDGKAMFFYYDESDYRRYSPLGKTEFVKLLRKAGSMLEPTPRMVREVPGEIFDELDRLWPRHRTTKRPAGA